MQTGHFCLQAALRRGLSHKARRGACKPSIRGRAAPPDTCEQRHRPPASPTTRRCRLPWRHCLGTQRSLNATQGLDISLQSCHAFRKFRAHKVGRGK